MLIGRLLYCYSAWQTVWRKWYRTLPVHCCTAKNRLVKDISAKIDWLFINIFVKNILAINILVINRLAKNILVINRLAKNILVINRLVINRLVINRLSINRFVYKYLYKTHFNLA